MRFTVSTAGARLVLLGGVPAAAIAQGASPSSAPPGTKGLLKVTINVTGEGRDGFRSGVHDSLRWQIRHTVSYETALEVTVDWVFEARS